MGTGSTFSVLPGPSPERVLLYSDDEANDRGLRRCIALARQLVAGSPRVQVVLVTGATPRTPPSLPPRVSILCLPVLPAARACAAAHPAAAVLRRARAAIISDVAGRFEPDLVVADRSSRGAQGDLTSAVAMLAGRGLAARIVVGLGDGVGTVAETTSVGVRRPATGGPDRVAA